MRLDGFLVEAPPLCPCMSAILKKSCTKSTHLHRSACCAGFCRGGALEDFALLHQCLHALPQPHVLVVELPAAQQNTGGSKQGGLAGDQVSESACWYCYQRRAIQSLAGPVDAPSPLQPSTHRRSASPSASSSSSIRRSAAAAAFCRRSSALSASSVRARRLAASSASCAIAISACAAAEVPCVRLCAADSSASCAAQSRVLRSTSAACLRSASSSLQQWDRAMAKDALMARRRGEGRSQA